MPERPLHICARPGCHAVTRARCCERHQRARSGSENRASPEARGYTYRWRKESKQYLKAHPWCAACMRRGRMTAATEVDHTLPHKGNQTLFWDESNWQSLCRRCHSIKTAREDGGFGNILRKGPPPHGDSR